MIHALRKRQLERMQWQERMLSQLTAVTANFSFCRPESPFDPEFFMLHPIKRTPIEPEPLTGEMIQAAFSRFPKTNGVQ